jgi:hypothetical protein
VKLIAILKVTEEGLKLIDEDLQRKRPEPPVRPDPPKQDW